MSSYTLISEREQDAIIAGLRILQRDMERGCVGDDIMPILTDEGAHDGLGPDEIEDLLEDRVNRGVLLNNKSLRHPPYMPPEMHSPVIEGEAHPDDRLFTVSIDANRWFVTADADVIIDLAAEYWSNSEASDQVAEDIAGWDADVQRIFDYLAVASDHKGEGLGFECVINGDQAMAWLKQHRPDVWARILCEQHEVRLVEATEPEIAGRWDWIDDAGGNGSEMSLETIGDAAWDAVSVLALEYQPESA